MLAVRIKEGNRGFGAGGFTEAVGTSFEKLFSFIHGPERPQVVYAWQVIVDQSNR